MIELADEGVVLRTYPSGEADRVVVLWTRTSGKVRLLARGVRRPQSRMGGALEPLAHVRVDAVRSRGALFVTRHVAHLARFEHLRTDYDRILAGLSVIEAIDAIPVDDLVDNELYETLLRVLVTLDDPTYYPTLVAPAFFARLLVHDGVAPEVNECARCASPGPLVAFHAPSGGALCRDCRTGRVITPEALGLAQRMLGGDLAGVLREARPAGSGEITAVFTEALEEHLGRRLKSARTALEAGTTRTVP
ncbi:MAG: DNA repair protein RecO [Acidimicrobiaceae bacterium]|nr:DNA repair protein RecO [Acidimicrobiaceae bacterium]